MKPVAELTIRSAWNCSSTMERVDAVALLATTAAVDTRAIPMVSAAAVAAVRRGLRVTLPRATFPTGRKALRGRARPPSTVGTITGAMPSTPMRIANAPAPRTGPLSSRTA